MSVLNSCCLQWVVDEKMFDQFRQDKPHACFSLSQTQGQLYANEITIMLAEHKVHFNWIHIMKNDLFGNPPRYVYHMSGVGKILISPNTLQYVCLAMKCLYYMKQHYYLKEVDMYEVKGGYGGQAFIFLQICSAYKIHIVNYVIYDSPNVLTLQQKYLTKVLPEEQMFKLRFFNPHRFPNQKPLANLLRKQVLFSSDFHMSFCQVFAEKQHCMDHGYIVWKNEQQPLPEFYKISKRGRKAFTQQEESPLTRWHHKIFMF